MLIDNNKLEIIDLTKQVLDDAVIDKLITQLDESSTYIHLDLAYANCENQALLDRVINALVLNPFVEIVDLYLANQVISSENLQKLLQSTSINTLRISIENIADYIDALAKANINRLFISHAKKQDQCSASMHCSNERTVILQQNNPDLIALNDQHIIKLTENQHLNSLRIYSMQYVDRDNINITDLSMASLAKAPQLTELVIEYVNISDDGMRMLAENRGLQVVEIYNSYRDRCLNEGFVNLVKNNPLKALRLHDFILNEPCLKTLAKSKTIKSLNLHFCSILKFNQKSSTQYARIIDFNVIDSLLPNISLIELEVLDTRSDFLNELKNNFIARNKLLTDYHLIEQLINLVIQWQQEGTYIHRLSRDILLKIMSKLTQSLQNNSTAYLFYTKLVEQINKLDANTRQIKNIYLEFNQKNYNFQIASVPKDDSHCSKMRRMLKELRAISDKLESLELLLFMQMAIMNEREDLFDLALAHYDKLSNHFVPSYDFWANFIDFANKNKQLDLVHMGLWKDIYFIDHGFKEEALRKLIKLSNNKPRNLFIFIFKQCVSLNITYDAACIFIKQAIYAAILEKRFDIYLSLCEILRDKTEINFFNKDTFLAMYKVLLHIFNHGLLDLFKYMTHYIKFPTIKHFKENQNGELEAGFHRLQEYILEELGNAHQSYIFLPQDSPLSELNEAILEKALREIEQRSQVAEQNNVGQVNVEPNTDQQRKFATIDSYIEQLKKLIKSEAENPRRDKQEIKQRLCREIFSMKDAQSLMEIKQFIQADPSAEFLRRRDRNFGFSFYGYTMETGKKVKGFFGHAYNETIGVSKTCSDILQAIKLQMAKLALEEQGQKAQDLQLQPQDNQSQASTGVSLYDELIDKQTEKGHFINRFRYRHWNIWDKETYTMQLLQKKNLSAVKQEILDVQQKIQLGI